MTSQGLVLDLARHDEEAREGDVVVMMKGAERPWLLRHVVGDDQENFMFVGACEPLYTHISGLKDWRSMNEALFKQTRVQFFARNGIREFRLV